MISTFFHRIHKPFPSYPNQYIDQSQIFIAFQLSEDFPIYLHVIHLTGYDLLPQETALERKLHCPDSKRSNQKTSRITNCNQQLNVHINVV
jgi:hypothetical protein